MNTPGYGTPNIVSYGNGGSTNGAPPAVDHRIYIGGPMNFRPPSLTIPPRLAIIERVTPRTMNATATIARVRSRATVTLGTGAKRIADRTMATARALNLRISSRRIR